MATRILSQHIVSDLALSNALKFTKEGTISLSVESNDRKAGCCECKG